MALLLCIPALMMSCWVLFYFLCKDTLQIIRKLVFLNILTEFTVRYCVKNYNYHMVNIFYLFCLTLSFVTLVLHVIYFGNDKSRTFYEYLYMGYQEMGKCRKFFGEVK